MQNDMLSVMDIAKAEEFILKNARPLERAQYMYFFRNGSREDAILELIKYQNNDGGFGHALEPDNWNPLSTPIATNEAIFILDKIDALDISSPFTTELKKGIVKYLRSEDSYIKEKRKWQFSIASNTDFPHAVWWEIEEGKDGTDSYNPTVSLAAFMMCYDEPNSKYSGIVEEAFQYLQNNFVNSDCLKCYLLAYRMLKKNGKTEMLDMTVAKKRLQANLYNDICKDLSRYGKEYVQGPSDFFVIGNEEFLDSDIRELIAAETEVLHTLQMPDGAMEISWKWYTEYAKEFEESRTVWRSRITMDRLLFARRFM